jgi:6-phosphogluconolactonase
MKEAAMTKLDVCPDAEALAQAAARLVADRAQAAVAEHGRFSLNLSGGTTPRRVYEILAGKPYRDQVPWQKTHVFWGDERCVPPNDARYNARMAKLALLDHVPIPPAQVHPIAGDIDPAESARQYEALLKSFFSGGGPEFDLILLGLGDNGHTASLFPNTPVLDEKKRWVKEVYVDEVKMWRITLTAPVLNAARVAAFLVAGAGKAKVLREVREGPYEPKRLPAQLIKPVTGELRWLVDQAAAGN